MKRSAFPVINEKKCKGCDVMIKRSECRDGTRFRIKQFHSAECVRKWNRENGGYGYGSLL